MTNAPDPLELHTEFEEDKVRVMVKKWKDIRSKAFRDGLLKEERVAEHRNRLRAEVTLIDSRNQGATTN